MLIFDIGANVGRYTQTYANNPSNTIISVEASRSTYPVLVSNVSKYTNVTPLHYAVSNTSDNYITFYESESHTLSTLDLNWLTSPESRFGGTCNYKEVMVPTITLDSLISKYGIPDILKVDVEGAEEYVLYSLTQKVPVVSFEWAAEWKDSLKRAVDHLVSLGFTIFHVQKEDKYDYFPSEFTLSSEQCKDILTNSTNKVDWGMIWAK